MNTNMKEPPEGFGSDEISVQLKRAEDELEAMRSAKRHMDYCRAMLKTPNDDVLSESINAMLKENNELRARAEKAEDEAAANESDRMELLQQMGEVTKRAIKAEAAVAEMRSLIVDLYAANFSLGSTRFKEQRDHALSTSCGTGWLSPEKSGRFRKALADCLEELEFVSRFHPPSVIERAKQALAETTTEDAK